MNNLANSIYSLNVLPLHSVLFFPVCLYVVFCFICFVSETKSKGFTSVFALSRAIGVRCLSVNACKYLISVLGEDIIFPPSLTAHKVCNFPYYLVNKFSAFMPGSFIFIYYLTFNYLPPLIHSQEVGGGLATGYKKPVPEALKDCGEAAKVVLVLGTHFGSRKKIKCENSRLHWQQKKVSLHEGGIFWG